MPINRAKNWAPRAKPAGTGNTGGGEGSNGAGEGKKRLSKEEFAAKFGVGHNATIESVTPKAFKTGSFGLEFKFGLPDGKIAYENLTLKTMNNDGVLTDAKYGYNTLKRHLLAVGFTSDEINGMSMPQNIKNTGNIPDLGGALVKVFLKDDEYNGKIRQKVTLVTAADGKEGQAA